MCASGQGVAQFLFANVVGSHGDSSPFSVACSSTMVKQSGSGVSTVTTLTFMGANGRQVTLVLRGPLSVGASFALASGQGAESGIIYGESQAVSSSQWVSIGGSATIDSLAGKTFGFTMHGASMTVDLSPVINAATGTFVLDGSGVVSLP